MVTFSSAAAGIVTGHAATDVLVGGLSLHRETDGNSPNSGDAVKRFVDAYITIDPDGVNAVGDPHTFTTTVWADDGLTAVQGGDGADGFARVDSADLIVTLAGTDGAVPDLISPTDELPADPTIVPGVTDGNGEFDVIFTSATPGFVIGHAETSFVLDGVTLVRETDGNAPNSNDAVKQFITNGSIHGLKFLDVIELEQGRMTGGGSVFIEQGNPGRSDDIRVTHGFELHCNAMIEPNNLEVNWEGNSFHLENLTSAACSDNPDEDQLPRQMPIDTYNGVGVGRFNGISGFQIEFKLTDFGEPGTKDIAEFTIKTPDGLTTILFVSNNLDKGNHQAHPENKQTDASTTFDGQFNGDEDPIEGVTVNLYLDANLDGVPDDGELFDSTTTDENGEYWFADDPLTAENEGLPPGVYLVREVAPDGFVQTTQDPPPITIFTNEEYVATEQQKLDLIAAGISEDQIVIEPLLAIGNTPVEEPADGRMTGGGSVFIEQDEPGRSDDIRVTHGFELHCNAMIEPNNLEVNWDGNVSISRI